MNTHVRLVGILHIIIGALGLAGAIISVAMVGIPSAMALWNGDGPAATFIGLLALGIGGFIALLSIPAVIAGWALLAGKTWARGLMIVIGILDLLNFPFGTALGIYTLWVLLRNVQTNQPYPVATRLEPAP